MTNKPYHLALSKDKEFQDKIDTAYARLAVLPARNHNGVSMPLRPSCKRIAHGAVIMLGELGPNELALISKKVVTVKDNDAPDVKVKHAAIQMDSQFSDLARLKSASLKVRFSVSMSTRDLIHYGIFALASAEDDEFQRLVYNSVDLEEGGAVRKYAFYETF